MRILSGSVPTPTILVTLGLLDSPLRDEEEDPRMTIARSPRAI